MKSKRLFLLRHAEALMSSDNGDKGRSLSPKGLEDAAAIGIFMRGNNYAPNATLCSPALRTRQTLEGVQQHVDTPNLSFSEILYDGSTGDYLYEIQKVSDEHEDILIIAHNPCIYELAILLAAQGSDQVMQKLSEGYPPATLSIINCKCDKWADIQPVENELMDIIKA